MDLDSSLQTPTLHYQPDRASLLIEKTSVCIPSFTLSVYITQSQSFRQRPTPPPKVLKHPLEPTCSPSDKSANVYLAFRCQITSIERVVLYQISTVEICLSQQEPRLVVQTRLSVRRIGNVKLKNAPSADFRALLTKNCQLSQQIVEISNLQLNYKVKITRRWEGNLTGNPNGVLQNHGYTLCDYSSMIHGMVLPLSAGLGCWSVLICQKDGVKDAGNDSLKKTRGELSFARIH